MLPEAPDATELSPDVALPDVEEPEFPGAPEDPEEDPVCAAPVPLAATDPELGGALPLDEAAVEPDGESLKASSPDVVPPAEPLIWAAV
jgi:hypothetical protein